MTKAEKVIEIAESQLGSPYVFGAWGCDCTPANRKKYLGYNPDNVTIKTKCQVLSGKSASCEGCKWQGCLAFDCRGFTYWCFKQVDIAITGSGATSQYNNQYNWAVRGTLDCMPDVVCCVFKQDGNKMVHTGIHVGGGRIIHCSNGVEEGCTADKGWTHFAIPAGLHETLPEKEETEMVKGKVIGGSLRLRERTNTTSKILASIPDGAMVDIVTENAAEGWHKVKYQLTEGYVMAKYIEIVQEEKPADYVTRAEFEQLLLRVAALEKGGG